MTSRLGFFFGATLLLGASACRVAGIPVGESNEEQSSNAEPTESTGDCRGTSFLGNWKLRDGTEIVRFTDACRFTSNVCAKTGTFTRLADASGPFTLKLQYPGGVAGKDCPAGGRSYECMVYDDHGRLTFRCGADAAGRAPLAGEFAPST